MGEGKATEKGWIVTGLIGSSSIHVFCVQYRIEQTQQMIEVPHLFGPVVWTGTIYTKRVAALNAKRGMLYHRLKQVDDLIAEAEGET